MLLAWLASDRLGHIKHWHWSWNWFFLLFLIATHHFFATHQFPATHRWSRRGTL